MARTLKYPDIKAGIRKAGPVPPLGSEAVHSLAWLAAAGYGRACLPALLKYQQFRASFTGEFSFNQRRRRRRNKAFTSGQSREAYAAALGIKYPGEIQNTRKKAQHGKRPTIGQYGVKSPLPLDERREHFVKHSGFFVAAAIKAYNAKPSLSRVLEIESDYGLRLACSTEQTLVPFASRHDRRCTVVLQLATEHGILLVKLPMEEKSRYGPVSDSESLSRLYAIGVAYRKAIARPAL